MQKRPEKPFTNFTYIFFSQCLIVKISFQGVKVEKMAFLL